MTTVPTAQQTQYFSIMPFGEILSILALISLLGKCRDFNVTAGGIHFACSGISHTVPLTALLPGTRPDIGRTRSTVVSRRADL